MLRRKRESERQKNHGIKKLKLKNTVGFVVRIHGGRNSSDEIKSQLRQLKLNKKYDGIFMNLDEAAFGKLLFSYTV